MLSYVAILMPYRLAFIETQLFEPWAVAELIIDALFLIDIFVNIFSSYYTTENKLETSITRVICNYAKGWLIIDLVACIPFSLIEKFLEHDEL